MISRLWSVTGESGGKTVIFGIGGSEGRTGVGKSIRSRV